MNFVERLARKINDFGEHFDLSGTAYQGIFKALDSGTISLYMDDTEAMGIVHPALLLITKADVPISSGNTITRDGRVYSVLKTATHRIGDTPVAKIAILN